MYDKRCFTYCGDLCDCGIADEMDMLIMRKRVAPAGDMINENESVSPASDE